MFKFKINYFILAIVLFIIEAIIGLYTHDAFIRPFMGDLLIGVFIYCVIKSFIVSPGTTNGHIYFVGLLHRRNIAILSLFKPYGVAKFKIYANYIWDHIFMGRFAMLYYWYDDSIAY